MRKQLLTGGETTVLTDDVSIGGAEYHAGTGALKIDVETSFNAAAAADMEQDDKFIPLKRDRGLVHSCAAVDAEALEAFRRDGVIQVKGCVEPEMIEVIHDAIALRRTAAVLERVCNAKKKSLGLSVKVVAPPKVLQTFRGWHSPFSRRRKLRLSYEFSASSLMHWCA